MQLLGGLFITIVIAIFLGLGATWYTTVRGVSFGGVTSGAWTAWPKSGTQDIEPYARAAMARSGELPLGSGDGVAFRASGDDSGRPFDGRCVVTLAGTTPLARYWTLTLYDRDGNLVPNAVGRHGFTSLEIVRASDGTFAITVSPQARPGNWLPSGGIDRYQLVLRLYDTAVGVATRAGRETPMPSVRTEGCP
ncbi:MAG TPA: DUF1214 domain-containing protein [Xanthobacteraceae bacterium]|nr:DUF1214 domain-containing protein [Xanthobacteraceae bacterium]